MENQIKYRKMKLFLQEFHKNMEKKNEILKICNKLCGLKVYNVGGNFLNIYIKIFKSYLIFNGNFKTIIIATLHSSFMQQHLFTATLNKIVDIICGTNISQH